MTEKRMPKRLARAEAHSFALEMIRQGIDGGGLWSYNDATQKVIEDELLELCTRHERYAGYATMDAVEKYRREQ